MLEEVLLTIGSDPETRLSLLVRLSDPDDQAAWEEFSSLYFPVIYRTARFRGLQEADAMDVSQQVFVSVGKALQQRPHDPSRARFRTWLSTVTRNAAIDVLRRQNGRPRLSGDHGQDPLESIADPWDDESVLDHEYQKELFRVAAENIRPDFADNTWNAFWMTSVNERPIEQVADELQMRVGSVYAARSRVIRRLRMEVQRIENDPNR